MLLSRTNEYRRMRPYLGTFVEIGVCGLSPAAATKAVNGAFACIATVQARMSAHNPASDLGRVYRAAPDTTVTLHPWTIQVIAAAKQLHDLSDGAFDITIGNLLERWRLLPSWRDPRQAACRGDMKDFELLGRTRIRVVRPTRIDLGGIAKGFAVDRAIEALIKWQPRAGWINAGGDMRTFGDRARPLLVRDPAMPRRILQIGKIQNGAAATSGGYFNSRRISERHSSIVHGRNCEMHHLRDSITVIARECMWADGLTKVLALDPAMGASLLDRFAATAWLLTIQRQGIPNSELPRLISISSK